MGGPSGCWARIINMYSLALIVVLFSAEGVSSQSAHSVRHCGFLDFVVTLTCNPEEYILVTEAIVGFSGTYTVYPCYTNPPRCEALTSRPAELCNRNTTCLMDAREIIIKDIGMGCSQTNFIEIHFTCNTRERTTTVLAGNSPAGTTGQITHEISPTLLQTATTVLTRNSPTGTTGQMTHVTSPSLSHEETTQNKVSDDDDVSTNAVPIWIIIVVVIVVILVLLAVGLAVHFCRKKKYLTKENCIQYLGDTHSTKPVTTDSVLPPGGYHHDDTLIVDNANYISIRDLQQDTGPTQGATPKNVMGNKPKYPTNIGLEDGDFEGTDMVDNANYASVNTDMQPLADKQTLKSPGVTRDVLALPDQTEGSPYDEVTDESEALDIGYFNSGYDEIKLNMDNRPVITIN